MGSQAGLGTPSLMRSEVVAIAPAARLTATVLNRVMTRATRTSIRLDAHA